MIISVQKYEKSVYCHNLLLFLRNNYYVFIMRKTVGIINMVLGVIIAAVGIYLCVKYLSMGGETWRFILYLVLYVGFGVLLFLIGNAVRKPRK